METEQLSLLEQLTQQVQALYDSAPGTAPQREADKWLTSLVGLDAAWPVLLHVIGPGAGAGQASPFDVRLTFIAAKIIQLKIQWYWRSCPPEIQQTVQAALVTHLQQQAFGGPAAPHDAPIVQVQLVMAFVHLLLQTLAAQKRWASQEEEPAASSSAFVMELCRMFGITGAPDLGQQLKPLLLLLSILKGLPEEHHRRGSAGGMDGGMGGGPQARSPTGCGVGDGPLRVPEADARTVVDLVGSVLAQSDAAEAQGLAQGGNGAAVVGVARRAKLAALQCLQAWGMYVMQAPAWVSLGDMAAWGLLPALEAQVALAGTERALEPEAFCTVLSIITDGLRSMSEEEDEDDDGGGGGGGYYGPAGGASSNNNGNGHAHGQGGEARRRRRDEVLQSVARVLLGIGRYVVQPDNAYAGDEDVPRSACEGLLTFLERHLESLWRRLGRSSPPARGPQGGAALDGTTAAVPMVRELLQLLLAFTAHPDLGGVALLTLELWAYLPEMLGLAQQHEPPGPASASAAALLVEVQPALVAVLARQCMGSPTWTAKEWAVGLGGARRRGGGPPGPGQGGEGEDEEAWARFADVLSFRSEAADAAEAMASTWPERHRVGELLYGVMAQQSEDPLAVEAILWLLTGVARGLQNSAELELEEDDYGGGGGGDDGSGGDEGGGGGGGGCYGPAGSSWSNTSPRRRRPSEEEDRVRALLQPQLWAAVIQGLASLQDPGPCFFLWHTACLLLHDLSGMYLADAPAPTIDAAAAFLLRALAHPITCPVAAAALKQTCLRCCDPDKGRLGRGRERATAGRLGGMLTLALRAAQQGPASEEGGRLLLQRPRAYADLVEALLFLTLSSSGGGDGGGGGGAIDALVPIVTATIAGPAVDTGGGLPRRADRALVLCASLHALGHWAASDVMDAVVERAWAAIDASIFGALDPEAAVSARQRQESRARALLHPQRRGGQQPLPPQSQHGTCDELSAAVGACCDVLCALLPAVGAKARFLPLLLGKALALVEYNARALAAFREATTAGARGVDTRRAADEAGVLLWPGPVGFVRRVLRALWAEEEEEEEGDDGGDHYGPAAGGGNGGSSGSRNGGGMMHGIDAWWGLLQQGVDAAIALARAALELRVADEDEVCGDQGRRQLLVLFYEDTFLLLRDVASLRVSSPPSLPPPSAMGADPFALRRGLELAVLALEIPLENSASLRAVLSLLDALLKQQGDAALLPLLQGLPPRLLPAVLRTLVAPVNLPSNVRRQVADVLHLLLCNGGQGGNNGPLPRSSALFQQALAALLAGGEGSAALQAVFAHDPAALAFVAQGLTHLADPAASAATSGDGVRDFVRCFSGLGRGEMTLEEAQESMASVSAGGQRRRMY